MPGLAFMAANAAATEGSLLLDAAAPELELPQVPMVMLPSIYVVK
jgi:hypothetical protein